MPDDSPELDALQDASVAADAADEPASSGFNFAFADRIDYLRPDVWDQLTDNSSIFLTREYLRLTEQHGPPDLGHRYAIVYRGSRPVAAVACQSLTIDGAKLVNLEKSAPLDERLPFKRTVESMREKALSAVRRRILCCGNLLSWGPHGWAVAPGENPADVWRGIADALYRIRRADKLSGRIDYILVKDVVDAATGGQDALRNAGYRPLETDPEMELQIRPAWRSYDDYLADMNNKYRKSVRNVQKSVEKAGYLVEPLADLSARSDVLHRLYEQVASRAGARITHQPPDYLPAMADRLGPDRFRCTVIRRDDEIVGFVTTVRDADACIGYYLGLDYRVNADVPIYLRLLQAVIENAIQMQVRRVSFGRTALEPKARLGAQPVPMHVWIRHTAPVLNPLVRQLLKVVPHDEAPERSPFKDGG